MFLLVVVVFLLFVDLFIFLFFCCFFFFFVVISFGRGVGIYLLLFYFHNECFGQCVGIL